MIIEPKERLYTLDSAAKRLNITKGRVHQLITEGRISAMRVAKILLVPESQLEKYETERRPYSK
ncbi:helix-turn-helix domain-containing protein [Thermopirellula anaerolimosa]